MPPRSEQHGAGAPSPRFPSFRAPLSPLHTPLPSPHFGPASHHGAHGHHGHAHSLSAPHGHSHSALVSALMHTLWNIGPDSAKLTAHRSCEHIAEQESSIDEAKCIDTIKNPSRWCCANCETSNSIRMCLACGECACERHSYLHFEAHSSHPLFLQLNAESKPCFCYACRFVVGEQDSPAGSLRQIREVLDHVQNLNIEILSKTTRSGRKRMDSTQAAAAAAAAAAASAAGYSSSSSSTVAAAASSAPSTASVLSGMLSPTDASGASTAVKASWGRVRKWQKVLPFLSKQAQAARRTEDSLRTVLFRWRNRCLVRSFCAWKYWMTTGREARLKRRAEKEAAAREAAAAAGGPGALKRKFADDLPMLSFDLSRIVPEGSEDDDAAAEGGGAGGAKSTRSAAAAAKRSKLVHPATASASSSAASAAASLAATAGLMLPPPPRRPKRSRSEERQKPPAPDPDAMPPPGQGLGLRRQPSLSADDLLSPPGSANARRKASASARCSPKGSRSASPRPGGKAGSSGTGAAKLPVIKLSKGVMGLRNLGNTCYLNSVVQALSLTPLFRQYYTETIPKLLPPIKQNERHLLNARAAKTAARKKSASNGGGEDDDDSSDSDSSSDDEDDHSSLSRDFSALLSTIWAGSKIQFTPDHFLQTVWTLYERFRGFKQQDAQEFTLFLMNQLSREQEMQCNHQKLEAQYKHPLWHRAAVAVRHMMEREKKAAAAAPAAAATTGRNNNASAATAAAAASSSGKKRKKGELSTDDTPAVKEEQTDSEEQPSNRRRSGRASTVSSTTSSSSLAHQPSADAAAAGTSSSSSSSGGAGNAASDAKYPPVALPLEIKHLESIPLHHAAAAAALESPPAAATAALPAVHGSAASVPKSILSRSDDFIVQNFAGVIRNAIQCQECSHVSATETGFLGMISVEIPPRAFSDPNHADDAEGDATMTAVPPSPSGSRSMADRERGLPHSSSSLGISGGNPSASFMSMSRGLHHSRSDSLSLKDAAQAAMHMAQQESLSSSQRKKHHASEVTLQKCLSFTFNNPEILEGANAYACSGCCVDKNAASAAAAATDKKGSSPASASAAQKKKLVRASKSTSIAALPPEYLFIHIGRTVYDMSTFSSKKDQTHIAFPLRELDMSACFAHQQTGATATEAAPTDAASPSPSPSPPAAATAAAAPSHLYDLYAVVNHHGRGLNEGHFTSFGYSEEHASWLLFNDARVNIVSPEKVLESQAYMLFYKRRKPAAAAAAPTTSA